MDIFVCCWVRQKYFCLGFTLPCVDARLAMAEPASKKRRFEDVLPAEVPDWIEEGLKQLHLEAGHALKHFTREALSQSMLRSLDYALEEAFPDKAFRKAVVCALHGCINEPLPPPTSATSIKH